MYYIVILNGYRDKNSDLCTHHVLLSEVGCVCISQLTCLSAGVHAPHVVANSPDGDHVLILPLLPMAVLLD